MEFAVGDSVQLVNDKQYGDVTIPQGTPGVVMKLYELSANYLVKFRGYARERRVPEADLEAAP